MPRAGLEGTARQEQHAPGSTSVVAGAITAPSRSREPRRAATRFGPAQSWRAARRPSSLSSDAGGAPGPGSGNRAATSRSRSSAPSESTTFTTRAIYDRSDRKLGCRQAASQQTSISPCAVTPLSSARLTSAGLSDFKRSRSACGANRRAAQTSDRPSPYGGSGCFRTASIHERNVLTGRVRQRELWSI